MAAAGPPILNRLAGSSRHLPQCRDGFGRVDTESLSQIEEFHHVNPPLAAFEPGHEGLVLPQPGSKVGLRQASGLPLLNDKVDQSLVPCRSQRFPQLRPASPDAGSRNNLISRLS